ncbi:MAG: molybdopterin-binding/glycosyltransferase family 2 protein [Sneathiellaceae bacterium]
MKFGPLPVADCAGALLGHSLTLDGRRLKKGHRLSEADAHALAASGRQQVIAARLEDGDVLEDAAADRIAARAGGPHVRINAAFTGRANLYAAADGVTLLDVERLQALNQLHEAVTIATLAPFETVSTGQMLATIKIIPLAAPESAVAAAEALAAAAQAAGGALVQVAPFRQQRIGLILTALPESKDSVLNKTVDSVRARVEALGSDLAAVGRCGHDIAEMALALDSAAMRRCDLLLVFGASAIVDRGDVIPAGIQAAGGTVQHFGMPVDPGNLLLLGALEGRPVIGLPGCARSPKINGFDWVLQRLLADLPVTGTDLMATGIGGLLKEIPSRPQPREGGSGQAAAAPRMPQVAAVVLAAGLSRRMGARNKMTSRINGKPLVRWVAEAALASSASETLVVLGDAADEVRGALSGLNLRFVENPEYRDGMASSIRSGLAALPDGIDGALICLGDMPDLRPAHLDRLISAFNPVEGRGICVPTFGERQGNPVLWGKTFFPELKSLTGDRGGKALLAGHADALVEVSMADDGILTDLDTPEAIAAYMAKP